MTVNIKCGPTTTDFEMSDESGARISGVVSCEIDMRPNNPVRAKIGVFVDSLDIEAHPLLTLDSLRDAARHYGMKLVEE